MSLHDSLKDLFLVDQQLRGLESRLDGARHNVRAQQIKLDQLTQQHEELTNQLKQTQASTANAENDVRATEQRIERSRGAMNNAKTNKEYSALLVEVNTLKADKGKLEETALQFMSEVDNLREELQGVEARLEEQRKIMALAEKELEQRQSEVGDRLAQLKAKRETAARAVPAEPLAIFERLADQYDGEGMCPVIEVDHRRMEFSCGGCYMSIPMEVVNRLATQDQVTQCPSCGRMLYLEQELRASMGAKS